MLARATSSSCLTSDIWLYNMWEYHAFSSLWRWCWMTIGGSNIKFRVKVEYWFMSCFAWIQCLLCVSVYECSLMSLTSSLYADTENSISIYFGLQYFVAISNNLHWTLPSIDLHLNCRVWYPISHSTLHLWKTESKDLIFVNQGLPWCSISVYGWLTR